MLILLVSMVLPVVVAANVGRTAGTVKFVAGKLKLPNTEKVEIPEPEKVVEKSKAVMVQSLQAIVPDMVTVKGEPLSEPASKYTLSAEVGTLAPPVPPDVVDQLVVELAFQVPAPPTQYLSAIVYLFSVVLSYRYHIPKTVGTVVDSSHIKIIAGNSGSGQYQSYGSPTSACGSPTYDLCVAIV